MPNLLYKWIDRRGVIPKWVHWFWPKTHWCCEFDFLLVTDDMDMELSVCGCLEEPKP